MFVRRRPLLRGAMIGGAGVVAGRNAARRTQYEQDQEARIAQLESQPAPPQAAAPPAGQTDLVSKLKELQTLQQQGVLSADEFDAAKKKLLES